MIAKTDPFRHLLLLIYFCRILSTVQGTERDISRISPGRITESQSFTCFVEQHRGQMGAVGSHAPPTEIESVSRHEERKKSRLIQYILAARTTERVPCLIYHHTPADISTTPILIGRLKKIQTVSCRRWRLASANYCKPKDVEIESGVGVSRTPAPG
jgi:hypothetical protein